MPILFCIPYIIFFSFCQISFSQIHQIRERKQSGAISPPFYSLYHNAANKATHLHTEYIYTFICTPPADSASAACRFSLETPVFSSILFAAFCPVFCNSLEMLVFRLVLLPFCNFLMSLDKTCITAFFSFSRIYIEKLKAAENAAVRLEDDLQERRQKRAGNFRPRPCNHISVILMPYRHSSSLRLMTNFA